MVEIIHFVRQLFRDYGREAAIALLLHLLLLLVLLQTRLTPRLPVQTVKPVMSYLYQPAVPTPVEPTLEPAAVAQPLADNMTPAVSTQVNATADAVTPTVTAEAQQPALAVETTTQREQTAVAPRPGLAQRALQRALTAEPAAIEQAAASSYQQFINAQQQVKLTVAKRHQQLSDDPAKQVIAQLDNGLQLVRTKDGCRIVDPSKHGFEALMAAGRAPCGDEISTSELLRQALEKHLKR